MSSAYPLPSFYFTLSFSGITYNSDMSFQEASGIDVSMEVDPVYSGGQNNFHYKLPKPAKYSNLVLKRGQMAVNSQLTTWCVKTMQNGLNSPIQPKTITLKLLNEKKKPVITWTIYGAYPIKWNVSDFKAQENALSVETVEFAYQYFKQNVSS